MRKILVGACSGLLVVALAGAAIAAGPRQNWRTHTTGSEEVPAVATKAQGQAKFQMNAAGTALSYRVNVAQLPGSTQAHLHRAPRGTNGPVVCFIRNDTADPVTTRINGTYAVGTITADDLIGPMAGMTMADLAAEIGAGNIYLNIHTPGNPGGEIRGQVR